MNKRRLLITLLSCLVFVGFIFIYFQSDSRPSADHPSSTRIQSALKNEKIAPYYEDLIPKETDSAKDKLTFTIDSYELKKSLPVAPQSSRIFKLKSDFTSSEVSDLAGKLLGPNLSTEYLDDHNFVSLNSKYGTLTFNTKTGSFSFVSLLTPLPFQISASEKDIRPELTRYLKDSLGVIDNTITATAYYQRSTEPGVTYYEFHRDWKKAGLPIVSPVGIINLPESKDISELSLTEFSKDSPSDDTITIASDMPKKKRNTDFNTLTIAVSDEGYILHIDSNIRLVIEEKTLADAGLTLLDPDKVIDELKNNGSYFNIALPAGEGVISLEKVFPDHTLKAKIAEVNDIALVYTEKPEGISQKYLYPSYMVRGVAETETGVRVRFSQTIPAIDDISRLTQKSTIGKVASFLNGLSVRQVYAQTNSSQCFTEVIYPCGDGDDSIKCKFTLKRCITPTSAVPTGVPTIVGPSPTPNVTQPQQNNTPTPPKDIPSPCVLYEQDETGNPDIVELASEFKAGKPDLERPINPFGYRYEVPGIGIIAYFPVHLPDGPIAVRISSSTTASPGTPLYGGGVIYGAAFWSLQQQVEFEVAIRAAIRIQANPSLFRYIDHPRFQLQVIDLNRLFPEVDYDMNDNRIMISDSIRWNIQQAVENYNGWTLEGLANTKQELASVPTRMLIGARRANFGDNPIGADANKYILDGRCKFMSPESPLIYFYPEKTASITLSFLHPHVVYGDPFLDNTLTLSAEASGKLHFGQSIRNKYHYEYDSVKFDQPQEGWLVPSQDILSLVGSQIAPQLGLSERETTDFLADIKGSLASKTIKKYAFVGLISESDLIEKLPFKVNPQPQSLSRNHLYISYTDTETPLRAPALYKISRKGFTVVELGVYVE